VPKAGECLYVLGPEGLLNASGGSDCVALSGTPLAGQFELSCAPDQSVRFELIYSNTAPSGADFGGQTNPADIDGRGAGPALQVLPCDRDGLSDLRVGGQISISSNAPSAFTGEVGTIRLEVTYD